MTTDLDHLEKLHREATGGEWVAARDALAVHTVGEWTPSVVVRLDAASDTGSDDDLEFIAASHNAMPALIAELRALRARVAEAEAEAAAEFAERKRAGDALRGSLVEANEKALEHLEARMRAEAERDIWKAAAILANDKLTTTIAERDALREVAGAARVVIHESKSGGGHLRLPIEIARLGAALRKVPA